MARIRYYNNYDIVQAVKNNLVVALNQSTFTKKDLAESMGLSYPTMLTKLSDPGTLKISEMVNLCSYLNIDINDLLNKTY